MAKQSNMMDKFGNWAFIIGIIIAMLAGVVIPSSNWIILVLAVLGLVVGFLNIRAKETTSFLVAAIAMVVSTTGMNTILGNMPANPAVLAIQTILENIGIFVAPAALLVALKAIYSLASED